MASIVDSFREIFGEKFAVLKLLIFTLPTYYSYYLYETAKNNYTLFTCVAILTIMLLLGLLIKITNNIIKEKTEIISQLNPIKILLTSLKCLVGIIPVSIIPCLIANWLCSIIYIIPWLDITLKSIIWLIVSAIILASFLLYASRERILDAFNLKIIFEKAGDMIIINLVFLIKMVLLNLITSGFLSYTIIILFGFGPALNFFLSFVLVFNLALTGHYMGQIYYENVSIKD